MFDRPVPDQKALMPEARTMEASFGPGDGLEALNRFVTTGGGPLLATGQWGLEREALRVEPDGQPATTPHPFPPGEEQISVDFAENQAELITVPHSQPASALAELSRLQVRLQQAIGRELLWPLSLPGRWDEPERVRAAAFQGLPAWEAQRVYRRNLEQRHGKARQVISGVHANFSFTGEFLAHWRKATGYAGSEREARDTAYFTLIRNFIRQQHVFNAIWGVSPPGDEAFWRDLLAHTRPDLRADAARCRHHISSVRLSPLGYALAPDVESLIGVRFDSLSEYRARIAAAIEPPDQGPALLAHEREFYSPVRPKPAADTTDGNDQIRGDRFGLLEALGRDGVGYLEFRVFDLDPYAPVGIGPEALRFFHVLMLACLFRPSPLLDTSELALIADRNRWSTLCGTSLRDERCRPGPRESREAAALFDAMQTVAAALPQSYADAVVAGRAMWEGRRPRPIDRLRDDLDSEPDAMLRLGLALARRHRDSPAHEP